jgi:XPC-binding domain
MEVAVNDLVMLTGRSKEDCTLALRAAQGVPDIAYEILSSGIPLNQLGNPGALAGQDVGDDYGDEDEDPSAEGGMPAGANPFAALASNPNFALIRQRILQDPNFYNQFMQQLQTSQPQLFALI